MSLLAGYLDKYVEVITNDGRVVVGQLRGVDQATNLVLQSAVERLYSMEGTEVSPLGLYIIRGDNVAVVGELDPVKDAALDLESMRAHPLHPVVH